MGAPSLRRHKGDSVGRAGDRRGLPLGEPALVEADEAGGCTVESKPRRARDVVVRHRRFCGLENGEHAVSVATVASEKSRGHESGQNDDGRKRDLGPVGGGQRSRGREGTLRARRDEGLMRMGDWG